MENVTSKYMRHKLLSAAIAVVGLLASNCLAQRGSNYYVVVLNDPPLAESMSSRKDLGSQATSDARLRIQATQANLGQQASAAGINVLDRTQVLLNALYISATAEQADAMRNLNGVNYVQRVYPIKRTMNKALDLVTARAAWNQVGGAGNAGAGVKIAVLDTGIDLNHPAFKDFTSVPPSGYPKCRADNGDCKFTNNKVIVARSYVDLLNFAFGTAATDTRPDDTSPRDRVGHGTAIAMVAAGQEHDSPIGRISGVAPRAYVGNYKVFGSTGLNDKTFSSVVVKALEDALADGMDIATLSLGTPAGYGPTDKFCGNQKNQPCDAFATAVQNAVRLGMIVTSSAGNSGYLGANAPALNTIESPGTAPDAITLGASTNSHIWYNTLKLLGQGVPSDLKIINTRLTNGPQNASGYTGKLVDVATVGADRLACAALPESSLAGKIALIDRGGCRDAEKVNFAQMAAAVGVIFVGFQNDGIFQLTGLDATAIPSALINYNTGNSVRTFLGTQARDAQVDPVFREASAASDQVASFSSQGPGIGNFSIKPDLTAVGTDLYMATQRFDPNGDMYNPAGFTAADGTSFAAPMAAGAAALVKQKTPSLTPARIRSALVNSANPAVTDFDSSGREVQASVTGMGAGRMDTNNALRMNVSAEPSSLGLGNIGVGVLPSIGMLITNLSSGTLNLTARVEQRSTDSVAQLTITPSTFSLLSTRQTQVTARLTGSRPRPGKYDGFVVISGGAADVRIPYSYFVGDGTPWNMYSISGGTFDAIPGYVYSGILMKIIDRYGVPVAGVAVRGTVTTGDGKITFANEKTDDLGIVEASFQAGSNIGKQVVRFTADFLFAEFVANVFPRPTISTDGVRDAASGELPDGFSAGQYISIYGSALSSTFKVFSGSELPPSLARVSVSFDNPSQRVSAAGRLHFASNGQVNVQIPWECNGLATVDMKVSIGEFSSTVQTLKLRNANPAPFEYVESGTNRRYAAALDGSFLLISTNNPARRGQVLQLFVNGLGPVDNTPGNGQISPSAPLARTTAIPEVKIGGKVAQVLFSGLAPGIVGLYQLNVIVPNDSPTGTDVDLSIQQSGATSRTSRLPVQ